jgi:hypothetical protein
MSKSTAAQGAALWQKQPKANAELFALTYGALVGELVRDYETVQEIQQQLDTMGHSIGIRCIEELLAKQDSPTAGSPSFVESADMVQMAFRMFLGVTAETAAVPDKPEAAYTVTFADNPLSLFVELPTEGPLADLEYSQLLCGLVRGVLEMLQFDVTAKMSSSTVAGHDTNIMLVELQQVLQQGAGDDYGEE